MMFAGKILATCQFFSNTKIYPAIYTDLFAHFEAPKVRRTRKYLSVPSQNQQTSASRHGLLLLYTAF